MLSVNITHIHLKKVMKSPIYEAPSHLMSFLQSSIRMLDISQKQYAISRIRDAKKTALQKMSILKKCMSIEQWNLMGGLTCLELPEDICRLMADYAGAPVLFKGDDHTQAWRIQLVSTKWRVEELWNQFRNASDILKSTS